MNISNNNHLNIPDLPNEILLIVFKKLNMVDVLYSLMNVTQRFDQLVVDPFYVRNLNMTSLTMKSFYDRVYSIDNQVLDKICTNILPRIHHQVNELIVEQHSMERVLHTINYPQLHSVSLIDFEEEILLDSLTKGNTILRKLLTEQITCLRIDVKNQTTTPRLPETLSTMFTLILSLCKRLIKLSFGHFYHRSTICTFELSSINCKSSTLTALEMNVKTFDDCLHLLDGRLTCLSTLIIHVEKIASTLGTIDNTVSIIVNYCFEKKTVNSIDKHTLFDFYPYPKLPKLKHFSLASYPRTFCYDNLIIPLLQRMINLEELILYLSIIRSDKNYIDGIQFYDDILIYTPRLNKFTSNIVKSNTGIDLSSDEDIQRSFIRREYRPVCSHVEISQEKRKVEAASIHFHINSTVFFVETILFKVACLIMLHA